MSDKLTAIKIKYPNGTYSEQILLSVLAENVQVNSTTNLSTALDLLNTKTDQIATISTDLDVLEARVDQIVAPDSGTLTLDEEVRDIRIGADAATYSTAGEAVREQITNLKNILNELVYSKVLDFASGGIGSTGALSTSNTRIRTNQSSAPVAKAGDYYLIKAPYEGRIAVYNNKTMQSSAFIAFVDDFATGVLAIPSQYAGQYAAILIRNSNTPSQDISSELSSIGNYVSFYTPAELKSKIVEVESNISEELIEKLGMSNQRLTISDDFDSLENDNLIYYYTSTSVPINAPYDISATVMQVRPSNVIDSYKYQLAVASHGIAWRYYINGNGWYDWQYTSDTQDIGSELTDLNSAFNSNSDAINQIVETYTQIPLTFESGNLASAGGQSNAVTFVRSLPIEVTENICIISDATYYFRVGIYNSSTVTTANFVDWITPGGYFNGTTTIPTWKYRQFLIPDEYIGKYFCIAATLDGTTDISSQTTLATNHLKAFNLSADIDRSSTQLNNNTYMLKQFTTSYFDSEDSISFTLGSGGINPETGGNKGTTDDLCKTDYFRVRYEDAVLFSFENPDYEWCCWNYSSQSVSNATHSNTYGEWISCSTPLIAQYSHGDHFFRIAFRRIDGSNMNNDLTDPTSDYSIITSGFKMYHHTEGNSANLINITALKGDANVRITHNDDGSITATTLSDGTYRSFTCVNDAQSVFKPNHVYALRCKIENIGGTTTVCYMRFRGIINKPSSLGLGIGQMESPGVYAAFYRATGYETRLDFFVTSATSASAEIKISELQVVETDISVPYIPYGVPYNNILGAIGVDSDSKSWGRQNAISHSVQYSRVVWTPVADMPSQFSSINYKFDSGVPVMGVPYSSARGVDKLVGPQVSLHTFLTATQNPRSVVYTRKLTYNNARTYYGCVCSAYLMHNYGLKVNLVTAELKDWNKLVPIDIIELKPGDILLNGWHVRFVTFVYRDEHGRILSVGWSEAGDSTVKDTLALPWEKFLDSIDDEDPYNVFSPYRYVDIDSVNYRHENGTIGYPEETITDIEIPDIMSEYGDHAVLLQGETTVINVLSSTGYSNITVKINGVTSQTISTLSDFTLTNLQPGLYEITISGTGRESTTSFYVCQATCSFDSSTKTLNFSSTNATPICAYVFSSRPTNRLVELSEEDIENGYINLADRMITTGGETYDNCKIAFIPNGEHSDWGVATWYTSSPEAMGFWTTI